MENNNIKPQEQLLTGDKKINARPIPTKKDGIIERESSKVVTTDGRELLKERGQ